MTSHQDQRMTNRRGTQPSLVPQIWCKFRLLFKKLRHFGKNGMRHFSLIGCHLESVSWTKPVFELNLAPSEERHTYEFRHFLSSKSEVATFVPGERSKVTRAKNRRKHWKIGRANSNLVALLVSNLWAMAGKNGLQKWATVRVDLSNIGDWRRLL